MQIFICLNEIRKHAWDRDRVYSLISLKLHLIITQISKSLIYGGIIVRVIGVFLTSTPTIDNNTC